MIYADYNGSSPLLPEVREYLHKRLSSDLFSNPNAIHSMGQKITKGMEKSREIIAEILQCYPDQIIFNSGSSEGISQIILSLIPQDSSRKNLIISSPIEHAVVSSALDFYARERGFKIEFMEVDSHGVINLEGLSKLLYEKKDEIALVTCMGANNETGVFQPFEDIQNLCNGLNLNYFCDTTQLIGKTPFSFEKSGLDFAVSSGHKLGSLTGTGFIIAKERTKIKPLIFGSTQENGQRGGTQNYLGIETLAVAIDHFQKNHHRLAELNSAKLEFEKKMKFLFPQILIIGEKATRLPGTTLLSYPGIHGQAVQIELESHNIFVTTSSACTDNQPETSRILKAMGVSDEVGRGVIRISLNHSQGVEEYKVISHALTCAYEKLKQIKSF